LKIEVRVPAGEETRPDGNQPENHPQNRGGLRVGQCESLDPRKGQLTIQVRRRW
jgi:hypothetical protein